MPPDNHFGVGNGSFQDRVADSTWKHAAEFNKKKCDEATASLQAATKELVEYRLLELGLDPMFSAVANGIRLRLSMRESLHHLAELFSTKYPKEDDEIVQNLIAIFTGPVERKLQGDADGSADGHE